MSNRPLDYSLNKPFRRSKFSAGNLFKDFTLVLSIAVLLVFGFFMLYSASGQSEFMVKRQIIYSILGLIMMFIVAQFQPRSYKPLFMHLFWVGIALLIYVLIFPSQDFSTNRWIDLGFISFQPSEALRLILPLSVASFLTRKELRPTIKDWVTVFSAVFLCFFLVAKQPDLGTALVVATAGLLPIFLSGFPFSFIAISTLILISLYPFYWASLKEYQQQRILTLFNPDADPLGTGWNIAQSKMAIGSGGLFGKGYLTGTQSQLNFIPESHSDFIFAVIAEELGLVGILFLITLYAIILWRIFIISFNAETEFNRLVASSIGFIFFIYVVINISMVVGVLPVVGVPLPLVSQGGTSLIVHLLAFGFVLSIKKRQTWS
ncbi:MAG: rod shape-determining protein RodA [Pseudomonadota bacterium]|nr:rod shape-determining protein RodA [Pseudomonadota bacterium]